MLDFATLCHYRRFLLLQRELLCSWVILLSLGGLCYRHERSIDELESLRLACKLAGRVFPVGVVAGATVLLALVGELSRTCENR